VPDKDSKSTDSWRVGIVEGTELQALPDTGPKASEAVIIRDAYVSSTDGKETILSNINVTVRRSTLTMIVGPVGSGKSTLLKAILGEANITSGIVQLACGPIAYCDETAWLRLGSVRENILGPNHYEEGWYQQVLHACALEKDVLQLDKGDQSLVGSAGVALSGGQKQRLVS
jgi:ABC-type bacteriocin/lantibiotic exporter with double-glycine peptidase domain